MKAFISYCLSDKDQYVLTLLSSRMSDEGINLVQSHDFQPTLHPITLRTIRSSQLFIGVITAMGSETDRERVISEWQGAKNSGVPSILLIENTVKVNPNFGDPYISFDRRFPEQAINTINQEASRIKKQKKTSNAWAWALGGTAAVALVGLLSSKE